MLWITRHRLFTLAALFSFLLCLAFAGGWVRSYFHNDVVIRTNHEDKYLKVESSLGAIYLLGGQHDDSTWRDRTNFFSYRTPAAWERGYNLPRRRWQGIQFFKFHALFGVGLTRMIILSYWLLVLLTAILPARWLLLFYRRQRERRRNRPGFPVQFKEQT